MNCHKIHDGLVLSGNLNLDELEKRANKTIEFPRSAPIIGNSIAIFTMLVLQEIIEQQSVDPITNLANITQLSNSIALLNNSIKIILV